MARALASRFLRQTIRLDRLIFTCVLYMDLFQTTNGLSTAFVFQDPLAWPQFHVQKLKETIALSEISLTSGLTLMTGPGGRRWACNLPSFTTGGESKQRSRSGKELGDEEQEIIDRGLVLLEPLAEETCLQETLGWWTYDFCYKDHIRQYRAFTVGGYTLPESESSIFMLSRYCPLSPASPVGHNRQVSHHHSKSLTKKSVTRTGLEFHLGRNVLVQHWENGELCPYTKRPRTVKVQYHCSTSIGRRIVSVAEPSVCSYVMMISVPQLCGDSAFVVAPPPEANRIECRQITFNQPVQDEGMRGEGTTVRVGATTPDLGLRSTIGSHETTRPVDASHDKIQRIKNILEGMDPFIEVFLTEAHKAVLRKIGHLSSRASQVQDQNRLNGGHPPPAGRIQLDNGHLYELFELLREVGEDLEVT